MSNRLRTALIVTVAIVWAANFMAPIIIKGYEPPPEINMAFMGIVGVLTASYNKNGNGSSNKTSEKAKEGSER